LASTTTIVAPGFRRDSRSSPPGWGIDDEELRAWLKGEIQRRLREGGEAWEKLDRTPEMRENAR
jgi:hypothetical protein